MFQQAPGFLGGKGAVQIGRVQQPEFQLGQAGHSGRRQFGIGQDLVEGVGECLQCHGRLLAQTDILPSGCLGVSGMSASRLRRNSISARVASVG